MKPCPEVILTLKKDHKKIAHSSRINRLFIKVTGIPPPSTGSGGETGVRFGHAWKLGTKWLLDDRVAWREDGKGAAENFFS